MKYKSFFILFSVLYFLSFASCQKNTAEADKNVEQSPFFVDDASHLYFKNMRAYYYDESAGPGANNTERMNLYKLRKFSTTLDRPILFPVIVDNWVKDEAYLFIEKNAYRGGFKDPLTVLAIESMDTTSIELTRPNINTQLEFAELIEARLNNEQDLLVLDSAGVSVPLFVDKQDRLNFLTALKDYQKLVEKQ